MNILVTGATGFIGGRAACRLLERGDSVAVLTRDRSRAEHLLRRGASVVEGDLSRNARLHLPECDGVLHCAGVPRPATRRRFRNVHVEGTRRLLDAARRAGVTRCVHVATQAVLFGGADLDGVDESQPYPRRFFDPYSESKAEGEQVALATDDSAGMRVVSIRPGAVWGRGDTTILPPLCRLASGFGVPLVGAGTNLQATTHIDNLVDALVAALERPGCGGKPYFVVDGFAISWRDFLARQLEACGLPRRFRNVPKPLARAFARGLDGAAAACGLPAPLATLGFLMATTNVRLHTGRAERDLAWRPHWSLENGLEDLAAWVRELGGWRAVRKGWAVPRP